MKKLSFRETQLAELDLLIEFDHVARAHHLKYSLYAGTMLGAVRHKGFIPWDDDIDIAMPRPDYEKLIRLNRKQKLWSSHLELKCFEDGTLEVPFMKLFDNNIRIKESNYTQKDVNSLWIDIFPCDGLPDDPKAVARHFRKASALYKLNVACVVNKGYGSSKSVVFVKDHLVKPFAHMMGRKEIARRQRRLALKYNYRESPKCCNVVWADVGPEQALPRKAFETLVELPFEGHSFLATSAWHDQLTGLFGDYMQLPPEEGRISHDIEAYRI